MKVERIMGRIDGRLIADMPLCGVFAVAHVANIPVRRLFAIWRERYSKRANWRGRTNTKERLDMIEHLGIKYKHVIPLLHYGRANTLKDWNYWHATPDETYIVETGNHVQILNNGNVADQYTATSKLGYLPMYNYPRKRCRVCNVVVIKGGK